MKIKFKTLTSTIALLISIMLLVTACGGSEGGASNDTPANNNVSDNTDTNENNEVDTDSDDQNNETDEDNKNTDNTGTNDDDVEDEDTDVVVVEPDMFEGYWIHVVDRTILIFDGYGNYTMENAETISTGNYEVDGETLYFVGELSDTWPNAHMSIFGTGGLIVDDFYLGAWFEREIPIYEAQNLISLSEDELVAEWEYRMDGYTCNLYDDGTFTLDEYDANYTGTYSYDGEEIILSTDYGDTFYGYFGEVNDVALLYLDGFLGYYENTANIQGPDPTTFYSGVYGEWFEERSKITLFLYDNNTYRIYPENAIEGIPSEGDLFNDYSDLKMFELGTLLLHDPYSVEGVGNISLVYEGEEQGKITVDGSGLYFTKIRQVAEGEPPSIIPEDGSAFSNLEIPILVEADGERYSVDGGAAVFSSEDYYETAFTDYIVEVLSDENDGTLRTVSIEATAYLPSWSISAYAPEELDFSFFYDFFDYQYGYILPTSGTYHDGTAFKYDMPNYDNVEISISATQDAQQESEGDDRVMQKLYFTVTMPVDYKNLVLGFMPLPNTLDEFNSLVTNYDSFQLGTSFEDLNYNLQGGMYYRFD